MRYAVTARRRGGRVHYRRRRFRDEADDALRERVQVVVGLSAGEEPEISIESTGTQPVLAQDGDGAARRTPGLLEGTITPADGRPVADARVSVPARGRAVRTNEKGLFQIELPPGNYAIEVSHPRYATQTVENLRGIPGKSVSANLSLAAGGVELGQLFAAMAAEVRDAGAACARRSSGSRRVSSRRSTHSWPC